MEFIANDATIDALDRLQKSLRDLIESLEAGKTEKQDLTVYAVPQPQPAEQKRTTLEDVRAVLVEKSREGKTTLVKQLLESFHAASLPEVDPADYADLLACAEKL